MAATTAIPGLGHFSKKEMYVLGGGAVVVVGIALYRSHEKSVAAAATAAASTTDTGADTTIDPTTGLPAGSPEDTAELEQESEYANNTDYGYSSGGDYTDPYSSTTGFTSNSQWSQAAQEYLTNYDGGDAATIGAALGAYLTGSYVTPAQVTVIEQAIAFEGAAPQPGTNGYPPSLNTTPPSTGTGTTSPTSGTKTIAQAAGTAVSIPSNIKSFGTLAKMASHFGVTVAHLQEANPGLSATATSGAINIPFLIKPGMTLASIAATFEESQEHIASVLATQGIV